MKLTALATLVGATALTMLVGVTAAGAGGRAARLEARATVIWVLTDSFTGEVLSVRNGAIDVTATDMCPTTDCGDRISASIDDGARVTEGTFETHQLPGHSNLFLPGGVDLQFVDGGEPGTRTVGPPNSAGVAPTTDYVQWLNTSPSVVLKGYLQTGNIQFKSPTEHADLRSTHPAANTPEQPAE